MKLEHYVIIYYIILFYFVFKLKFILNHLIYINNHNVFSSNFEVKILYN